MDLFLAKMFVDEEIWVEGVSNNIITWDGKNGWNFYYRISGLNFPEWHMFLYNKELNQLYYRDAIVEGQCQSVELKIRYKISRNTFIFNLFPTTNTFLDSERVSTCSEPMYYPYFCEPTENCDISKLLKYFPCKKIEEDCRALKNSTEDRVITKSGSEMILYIPSKRNESLLMTCSHPPSKILSTIMIHSHQKHFRFVISDDINGKKKDCFVCKIKIYLFNKNNNYHSDLHFRMSTKLSEYLINMQK